MYVDGRALTLRWVGHTHADGWVLCTQMGGAHTHMCTHIQTGPHFLYGKILKE